MIQDDIINELQYIPESKLQALYELIHYFRLGINSEMEKQSSESEGLKIDKNLYLNTLQKIKQGDFSSFSEIGDVKTYIEDLKDEIVSSPNIMITNFRAEVTKTQHRCSY